MKEIKEITLEIKRNWKGGQNEVVTDLKEINEQLKSDLENSEKGIVKTTVEPNKVTYDYAMGKVLHIYRYK